MSDYRTAESMEVADWMLAYLGDTDARSEDLRSAALDAGFPPGAVNGALSDIRVRDASFLASEDSVDPGYFDGLPEELGGEFTEEPSVPDHVREAMVVHSKGGASEEDWE